MENIDGALSFRATLDIDDFNVSAQAMENRIKDFSSSAIDEVESVEDVFQSFAKRAGEYISYYLVGQGMMGLLNSIVQVRGQFQQLEIAFETMLGSQSKAKSLMDQMVQTAAKTPFDLMGVAEGAKQLMAYGVSADKVNDTLVRLGNIASGLSIPLNDIVYLYGTTMVQGRLYAQDVRQFTGRGIPLVKELAEKYGVTADKINEMVSAGKIGFPEVEEVINKMTNAGGQFYNLMEKQSASLTGQIANLEDAWDSALNSLGEKGEGVFSTAISSATYLVEHLDDILRVLTAVTVAYGSYKAAVVLQTLVTKGYTGVALIDNTARSAKIALLKLDAKISGNVTTQTKAMTVATNAQTVSTGLLAKVTSKATTAIRSLWAACLANPLTAIISLIGAIASAIILFDNETENATDAMTEFGNSTSEEIDKLHLLFAILQNSEKGTKTHTQTLEKINAVCQEYNKTLLDENATLDEQKLKYLELTKAIQATTAEKIKAKYAEQYMNDLTEKSNSNNSAFDTRLNWLEYNTGRTRKVSDSEGNEYTAPITAAAENIRNMTPAVREAIRGMVESGALELANLTGDDFTNSYNEVISQVVNSTKSATGATAAEMRSFQGQLEIYLRKQIADAKTYNEQISSLSDMLDRFFAPREDNTTEAVLNAESSFEELDAKIQETQREIDEINGKTVKVDTDTTRLRELLSLLTQIQGYVNTKTANLNTEAGINSRIKQLREERANVEINSAKYKELSNQITTLENRIPRAGGGRSGRSGGSGGNNAVRNAETLLQKQLQAAKRLEEARIAVMEDGYEKRKATLDLQHKEELQRIDKEEKELTEARKKAGKGGLSQEEKDGFTEMRNLADQSYQRDQNDLLIAEIAEKKKQYQLYWRWVENMGKDVADKQFATLLSSGASYKEFLDKQIKALKDKQASGQTLTDGEQQQLLTLDLQVKEITGAKSAMDLFKDSVTRTINQAQTLAEKMEAIAKAKERLANGDSGLVSEDDIAAANLFLNQEDENNQKELQDRVLTQFRTFEEQKTSIQNEYALLRAEARRLNDEERIKQINQAENEALSALNSSFLMQSESWKNLFTDLDALTVEQIDKLVREIQDKLNTADLKLNPADLKAVLEKLDEAKSKILDVNPFKALGNSLREVFKTQQNGSKKTSKQIKTDWKNLSKSTEACFDFVNDAIASCSVLDDLLGDSGKATMEMIQGVAMAGIAMSAAIKSAEKGSVILTAISIALQAISWIAGLFNNDEKIEKRIQNIQRNIDALSNSFDRMQHAAEQTYWVFTDEEKEAHEKRLNAIRDQIAALEQQAVVAAQCWDFVEYARLTKQIKELKYALEKEGNKGDMFQLYEMQKQNLKEQQELIKQQIQAEKGKKKTDWDKIAEWEEAIKDIDTQLEDMERSMMETLAGTDTKSAIDEFADALVEAYCQGEDAAEALGAKTKEVLKNAVVEALKRQFLAKAIDEAIQFLGSAMEDGTLDPWEKSKFEAMVNAAGETFNNALEGIGDWIKDMDEAGEQEDDPLKGAIKGMSDQQADVLAGRANAIVINQSEMISIGRSSLVLQAEIAANTRATSEKLDTIIRKMENNNSLLSQGIS